MIEPNYLPFILIGGGIIFVVIFSLCTHSPLAFSQSIRCTHLIDTVILNAASEMSRHTSSSRQ